MSNSSKPPLRLYKNTRALDLSPLEIARKERALAQYKSQLRVIGGFMMAFVRKNELFGDNPVQKLAVSPALVVFPDQAAWAREELVAGEAANLTGVTAVISVSG